MIKQYNKKAVELGFYAPKAKSVAIGGDFNSWNPKRTAAEMSKDGTWKVKLNLNPGKYQYKFLVDGQWVNDPKCNVCVPNSFGTLNCVIDVK